MTREVQPEGELFGKRLRELRLKRGMTQEDLAQAAGTAGPYVSDMERGLKVPSLTTILRLASALKCKPTTLISVFDNTKLDALLVD
jgi:transcriptional regulator with XRE-family HTH domain